MSRRGAALLLVLVALALGGLALSAVFPLAILEQRLGRGALGELVAGEAAEAGVAVVLTSWPTAAAALPLGGFWSAPPLLLAGGARSQALLRRVDSGLFLVVGSGEQRDRSGQALAAATVGRLVRLVRLPTDTLPHPRPIARSWVALPH